MPGHGGGTKEICGPTGMPSSCELRWMLCTLLSTLLRVLQCLLDMLQLLPDSWASTHCKLDLGHG